MSTSSLCISRSLFCRALFFFSSRRRHTRCYRDWSSDVCSSDLALDAAYGILLSGEEETGISDYFIESAFPSREEVKAVLNAIGQVRAGLSVTELMARVNLSRGRLQTTIDLVSLESPAPIAKLGTKWQLTTAKLSEKFWQRASRLTELRRAEQRQMQEYVSLKSGHMDFLIRALDGDPCDTRTPHLPLLSQATDSALIREAIDFLRRMSLPFEPRKQWPNGGMPHYNLSGRIPAEYQSQPGRALCVWGDAGWGRLVREGKYHDGRFADDLIAACESLIRQWKPQPAPKWVSCVP